MHRHREADPVVGRAGQREARVVEMLLDASFLVELDGGQRVLADLSPAIRRGPGAIRAGDRVRVEVDPRDATRGRIVARIR